MALTPAEQTRFIKKDLYDLLKWLLVSTTLWEYYKNIDNSHGEEVALAMHTNIVCSRALFEFFVGQSENDAHITDFGIPHPYTSRRYKNNKPPNAWKEPINRHVMHISLGRASIHNGRRGPTNVIGGKHLKNMMVEFRDEILRMWLKLEGDEALKSKHRKLIKHARISAENDRYNAMARFNKDSF